MKNNNEINGNMINNKMIKHGRMTNMLIINKDGNNCRMIKMAGWKKVAGWNKVAGQ